MDAKEKMFEIVMASDILDADFAASLDINTEILSPPDELMYYELIIDFPESRIQAKELVMSFPVEDKPFIQNSSYHDRVGHVLAKQLGNIETRFAELGYDVLHGSIRGQAFDEKSKVVISLFKDKKKEYDKKDRIKKEMKVHTIVPSESYTRDLAVKLLAEMFFKEMNEKTREEAIRLAHTPNNVDSIDVFEAIARGTLLDQQISENDVEAHIRGLSDSLADCFEVQKDWPLEISGHLDRPRQHSDVPKHLDCSEWMIYMQNTDQSWTLKAINATTDVGTIIEQAVVQKTTEIVVVLHNLEAVSYSLMVQGKLGPSLIKKKDAAKYKKVKVIWDNIRACS